ncbi:hypothetical protein GCM10017771_92460 [Streptomyces capitiformicae]|uniref:HTH luxR-type domain-containing protein n=2 Tax=Streptomyces capitiformicae TaxID=2014920 RepID=A0A919DQ92_9ACTN|nr:hypothetical protein GCM10017771_92460 [Streptomyces capitiformicae]
MLLERQNELKIAAEALTLAARGTGSLIVISGPPGTGKSALLTEIGELAAQYAARPSGSAPRRPLVMRAYGAPTERDFSLGVVRQLLEPAVRSAPSRWRSPATRPALAFLASDPEAPQQHTANAKYALPALLATMSQDRTLVLLIDDLHWADDGSLDLFVQLASQETSVGILVVVTVCEGEPTVEPPAVRAITATAEHTLLPASLSAAGVQKLIMAHLGAPPAAEFSAACHEATRGNPLHVRSLLQECKSRGIAPSAAQAAEVATLVPPALRRRLLLCLREMQPWALAVARALMVLGDDADPRVVGELAGLDDVDSSRGLAELRRLALVSRKGVRLAHRAAYEVIEEATPLSERNRLHLRAADLLRYRGLDPERVATHLVAVTSLLDEQAVAELRVAADEAVLRGDPVAAARYLRRALRDSPPCSEERARLLVELATVERSFAPSVAVRHITQAYHLLSGPQSRAEALMTLTPVAIGTSLLSLEDLLRQTAQELGPADALPPGLRRLAVRLEARLQHLGENDPAVLASAAGRLARLGERPETARGDERELVAALLHTAAAAADVPSSRIARLARQVLDHTPATAAQVHTLVPLTVPVAVSTDSVEGLSPWLDTALEDAVRRGGRLEESVILSQQALVLVAHGRLAEAQARAVKACAVAGADEMTTLSSMALIMVALRTRQPELAAALPDRLRGPAENCWFQGLRTLVRGMEAERREEPALALEHYTEAGYVLERSGWRNPAFAPWEYLAARVHQRMGDAERAEELGARYLERARKWGAPAPLGRALALRASLAGTAAAAGLLRDAADVLEASADLHTRAVVQLRLAETVAPHRPDEAEQALRAAYDLAVACDASWVASRAQEMLGPEAVRGAAVRGAAAHGAALAQLTPAERMVAQMAVQGLTNQAIADALGVSRRAVEKHLTSCYRKMSTSGRPGLIAALKDSGLFDVTDAIAGPPAGEVYPQGVA